MMNNKRPMKKSSPVSGIGMAQMGFGIMMVPLTVYNVGIIRNWREGKGWEII
jgi:hypothetical protein